MKPEKLIILLLVFFLVGNSLMAQMLEPRVRILQGIREVEVLIETLGDDAEKLGLTEDRLRTATELKLRREGIEISDPISRLAKEENLDLSKIEDRKEYEILSTIPTIYVNVNTLEHAFSISLELHDDVIVERLEDPRTKSFLNPATCTATTWSKGFLGFHGGKSEYIINTLAVLLDGFLNDYYKANPRK